MKEPDRQGRGCVDVRKDLTGSEDLGRGLPKRTDRETWLKVLTVRERGFRKCQAAVSGIWEITAESSRSLEPGEDGFGWNSYSKRCLK